MASAPQLESFTASDVITLIDRQRRRVVQDLRRGDWFQRTADGKREPWVLIPGAAIVSKGKRSTGETLTLPGVEILDDRPYAWDSTTVTPGSSGGSRRTTPGP